MSTTYTLVCDDCKVKYWAGQSSGCCPNTLYSEEKVAAFLYGHCGHQLRFLCDHVDDDQSLHYRDVECELVTHGEKVDE